MLGQAVNTTPEARSYTPELQILEIIPSSNESKADVNSQVSASATLFSVSREKKRK